MPCYGAAKDQAPFTAAATYFALPPYTVWRVSVPVGWAGEGIVALSLGGVSVTGIDTEIRVVRVRPGGVSSTVVSNFRLQRLVHLR